MANICYNRLELIGKTSEIDKVLPYFKGKKCLFKYYKDGLTSVIRENGKKYETCYIEFETAWTNPEDVIKKLSKQFPKLDFVMDYDIEFDDAGEYYLYQNGKVLERYPI